MPRKLKPLTVEVMKCRVSRARDAIEEIQFRAEKAKVPFEELVRKTRARCPHHKIMFFPDPSGGSDSFWECEDCGKEWRIDPREKSSEK